MGSLEFISFSDYHYHEWNQFNKDDYRLVKNEEFLLSLIKKSHKHKVPILFSGDFFHSPEGLNTKVIYRIMKFFNKAIKKYPKFVIVGIDGNHDTPYELKDYKEQPSLFMALSYAFSDNIKCINFGSYKHGSFTIYGIPYLVHNIGFKKVYDKIVNDGEKGKKILLIHTNLLGAMDPSGYKVKEMEGIPTNMGTFFRPFDLVLSGHLHKHDNLHKGKVISVGAPSQQRKSDMGYTMGYLEIYSTPNKEVLDIKTVPSNLPIFMTYRKAEEVKEDGNFWVKLPEEKKLLVREKGNFNPRSSKVKLAKEYCKNNNIKSKKKLKELIKVLQKTEEE